MKISQTWLASQTGVSERWISARGRSPFSGPAGDQVPEAAAEVGAAEERVEGRPDPEDPGDDVGPAHGRPSPLATGGAYGVSPSAPAPASRQRRDIERRTRIAAVPIAA